MKKFICLSVFISLNAFASQLNLNGGESAVIQANVATTVTCGGNSTSCPAGSNPKVVCINIGYSPRTCSVLASCDDGQVACLNKGYTPATCAQ